MPSRRSTTLLATILLTLGVPLASAHAQEDGEEPRPRSSLRVVGAAGLGDGVLGAVTLGGSVEGDLWGRGRPGALGLRVGALAEGVGSSTEHGTFYGAGTFTVAREAGGGALFLATLAAGLADTRGAGFTNDSTLGFLLSVRGAYLAPVGRIRLGIGLDVLTVPGLGAALLASPMIDVPFF